MTDYDAYRQLSPTTWADCLDSTQIMQGSIKPLWPGMPRIAGPAYPVLCGPGDHLMLHAAIYSAPRGSVIVVQSGDLDSALAGGNVCAVAQKNGIVGFVLDGAIRDVAETRARGFPVFARGITPKAAAKNGIGELGSPVVCGGVSVAALDILIADEEGIVVVPHAGSAAVLAAAQARAAKDAAQTLDEWERDHRKRVFELLAKKGSA